MRLAPTTIAAANNCTAMMFPLLRIVLFCVASSVLFWLPCCSSTKPSGTGDGLHFQQYRPLLIVADPAADTDTMTGSLVLPSSRTVPTTLPSTAKNTNNNNNKDCNRINDHNNNDAHDNNNNDATATANDSMEWFSTNIDHVLSTLRREEYDSDPTIPAVYRRQPIYDRKDWWDEHTSSRRYLKYLVDFPHKSQLLRRVVPQLLVMVVWSGLAIWMCSYDVFVAKLQIGLGPMSLVSAFVASLLTLRGNQGLNRLRDARNAIGHVGVQLREMAQLVSVGVYPNNPQVGLLAIRHLSIFPWSLKAYLEGNTDANDLIHTMLPSQQPVHAQRQSSKGGDILSEDANYIINYKYKPPLAILMKLRQLFSYLSDQQQQQQPHRRHHHRRSSSSTRSTIDPTIQKELMKCTYRLNEAFMIAERVRISVVPALYTTHTTRLLLFYLFWLPFALYGTFSTLNPNNFFRVAVLTMVTTTAVGYAMLGLDEIATILSIPFRFMPLRQLAKNSMLEIADALVYRPSSYSSSQNSSSNLASRNTTMITFGTTVWRRIKERIRRRSRVVDDTDTTTTSSFNTTNNKYYPTYW